MVFAASVAKKVKDAESIGSKTSWTTRDHLAVLANLLQNKSEGEALDVLQECYNVSAFAQSLEKVPAFKEKGHFQRSGKGTPKLDELIASLNAAAEGKQG